VWFYRNGASPGTTATLSQIADELLASVELRACWLIMIEIAYQTNTERDIVEIIAVHVATIDLTPPAISDFDLPISGRCAVTNHEMIRQAVLHPADMSVVIVENPRVALPRAAVVHNNKLPTTALYRCASDCFNYGVCQVTVGDWTTPRP